MGNNIHELTLYQLQQKVCILLTIIIVNIGYCLICAAWYDSMQQVLGSHGASLLQKISFNSNLRSLQPIFGLIIAISLS